MEENYILTANMFSNYFMVPSVLVVNLLSGELTFCHGKSPFYSWENHKIHYFDWAIFQCFLYVHQRVNPIKIPLNPIKPPFSSGFPMVFHQISDGFLRPGAYASQLQRGAMADASGWFRVSVAGYVDLKWCATGVGKPTIEIWFFGGYRFLNYSWFI